jgi:hypothetical protein
MALKIFIYDGVEDKSHHTAAVTIPSQTNPLCEGSWPDPPPQIIMTFSFLN